MDLQEYRRCRHHCRIRLLRHHYRGPMDLFQNIHRSAQSGRKFRRYHHPNHPNHQFHRCRDLLDWFPQEGKRRLQIAMILLRDLKSYQSLQIDHSMMGREEQGE